MTQRQKNTPDWTKYFPHTCQKVEMGVDWLKWVFANELQFRNFLARQYLNDQEGQEETL